MEHRLLIVFVKPAVLGKVKTRLAKSVGNKKALNIYLQLLSITEKVTMKCKNDVWIFYADNFDDLFWKNYPKYLQVGKDLGLKMYNAFKKGFKKNYSKIVLIGSDLPEISANLIETAFNELDNNDVVIGPSADGGYYLIGFTKLKKDIFENKPWSTSQLLEETLKELESNNTTYSLLQQLNDIDTLEDLNTSSIKIN